MRTVTVEELEALRDRAWQLEKDAVAIAALHLSYDADNALDIAIDNMRDAARFFRLAASWQHEAIVSARTNAEADKADAKRKDV